MRSAYAWAIVVAVLASGMSGAWAAGAALLALGLLLAGDRDERLERRGVDGAGAGDPTP